MAGANSDDDWSLIEPAVRVAGALGFNPVRVRWKLARAQKAWRAMTHQAGQRVEHVRYAHRVCPACGAIQDRSTTRCTGCGERLPSRAWEILGRVGLVTPQFVSVSALLAFAMAVIYVRMVVAQGGGGILGFDIPTLLRFGAHGSSAVYAGQWWRLATAVFLHIGLWHIGFNLFALVQIGPQIEEIFGRGRMLFFFLLTGVVGNVASQWVGLSAVSAGASGAIMGLIGVAAGWGQRDGTSIGRRMRNDMLKWGLYTMVFGYLIGANNVAHGAGFVSGAVLGLAFSPAWLRRRTHSPLGTILGLGSLARPRRRSSWRSCRTRSFTRCWPRTPRIPPPARGRSERGARSSPGRGSLASSEPSRPSTPNSVR